MPLVFSHLEWVDPWNTALAVAIITLLLTWVYLCQKSTNSKKSPSGPKWTGHVRLIVDGSNGSMRLDKNILKVEKSGARLDEQKRKGISFLRVENGENRGDRIALLPALESFLDAHASIFDGVDIYFDGLGVFDKTTTPKDRATLGQQVDLSRCNPHRHVQLRITPLWDEADGIIVQVVADRSSRECDASNPVDEEHESLSPQQENSTGIANVSLSSLAKALDVNDGKADKSNEFPPLIEATSVFTFTRNTRGPGKSRQWIKRFCLLRPESVFCLFGVSKLNHNRRDVKQLMSNAKGSFASIQHRILIPKFHDEQPKPTIVATDDVFLRQRVVAAGGYVMTFEQLWELLSPHSEGETFE